LYKQTGSTRKRRRGNAQIPIGEINIQYLVTLVEKLKRTLDPPSQGLMPSVQTQNDEIPKRRGKNKIVIKKAGSFVMKVPSNIDIKTSNFMNKQKKSIGLRGNLEYSVGLLYNESYVLSVFMVMVEV
jgi:hypothetical protein